MDGKKPWKPRIDDTTVQNLRIREAIDLAIIAESAGCSVEDLAAPEPTINIAIGPNHWPMALSPAFVAYASPPCEVHRVAGKDVEFRNGMFWASPQLPPLFSPARKPSYQEVDEIRAAYRSCTISRDEAIAQIRRACDMTDAAAAEMLDHPSSPHERIPKIRLYQITEH